MIFSAKLTMFVSIIFALACFSVAFTGFTSLDEINEATKLSDAKGFAWFWTILGGVATLFGFISLWLIKTAQREEQQS